MPVKAAQSSAKVRPSRAAPLLPHERDQAEGAVTPDVNPVIEQAKHDIDDGLVDTDMRATPGLDAERRERLLHDLAETPPAERAAPRDGEAKAKAKARRRKTR